MKYRLKSHKPSAAEDTTPVDTRPLGTGNLEEIADEIIGAVSGSTPEAQEGLIMEYLDGTDYPAGPRSRELLGEPSRRAFIRQQAERRRGSRRPSLARLSERSSILYTRVVGDRVVERHATKGDRLYRIV